MPAKIKKTVESVLDNRLRAILRTKSNQWEHYFFSPDTMGDVLDSLNNQIRNVNFLIENYSITTFLEFLKTYVKRKLIYSVTPTNIILKKINIFLERFKTTVVHQTYFNALQLNIAIEFLNFLKLLFRSEYRHLYNNKALLFNAADLKQIAITVVKNKNATVNEFIETYLDTLKLSFDSMSFLKNYKQAHEGIISIAKIIFLDKNQTAINLLIIKLFSALAYEIELLDYYQSNLRLKNISACQASVLEATIGLQHYFFAQLGQREDVSLGSLKYYFFKYFIQKATLSAQLKNNYAYRLQHCSDENFNPLPYHDECPGLSHNQFIIKHSGLDKPKLEIVCQAKACTDRNHNEWLKRIGKDQFLPDSHYTFHIFSDEHRFVSDIYRYVEFEPSSDGFFTGILRNKTHAIGNAYALYKSDSNNWWQLSAHEYAHQLNYRAFGHLPRNFDEGLAYRVILDACISEGFQNWLRKNHNQYTSLKLLSSSSFIGYNPSSLLMSYFVDTNSADFSTLLSLYPNDNATILTQQLTHVIRQDTGFLQWLDAYQRRCAYPNFRALGEGNHYCPQLITDQTSEQLLTEKTSMAPLTTTMRNDASAYLTQKKLSPEAMTYDLILAIYSRDLLKFRELLQKGANVNYPDAHNGNTPLHYLYYYANCDSHYLEEILNYNPVIIKNNAGLLPYALAERNCNSTQLHSIQVIFSRYRQSNKIALTPYQEQPLAITISVPLSALISGGINAGYNEITERYSKDYPYLRPCIFYGLKPASLALGSAAMNVLMAGSAEAVGLEEGWLSFVYYLSINYFGLIVAQLGEKAAKKIKNQLVNFLITILFYTFFLNPSLLTTVFTEDLSGQNFVALIMLLLSMLSSGLLFKTGEWCTQKMIRKCFPVNREYKADNKEIYSLSRLLAHTSKTISEDTTTLRQLKEDFDHLVIKLKKRINNQVYKLSFDENIESATQNILALLEISQGEGRINQNHYRSVFEAFKMDLKKIEADLNTLSEKKDRGEKNISALCKEVSVLLVRLREIHPLPKLNTSPDLSVVSRCLTSQEKQINLPLMASSIKRNSRHEDGSRYTQPPALLGKMHTVLFIKPKTESPSSNEEQKVGFLRK